MVFVYTPKYVAYYNEEPDVVAKRSDDVSPFSNGQLYACAGEKIARTFADSVGLFNLIILSSLVCVCGCVGAVVCASTSVHRTPQKEHGFRPRARLCRPLFSGTPHLYPGPKPC